MVALCVHPCRSRKRVGVDGPALTDICGCRGGTEASQKKNKTCRCQSRMDDATRAGFGSGGHQSRRTFAPLTTEDRRPTSIRARPRDASAPKSATAMWKT